MSESIYLLIFLFFIKHFICDFLLQTPYMYKNKGTFGHPGGILHALIHAVFTLCIILLTSESEFRAALILSFFDFSTHYSIDYAKIKVCKMFNLKPDNSEWYWVILGLDQTLHYMCYLGIIIVVAVGIK